MKIDNTIVLAPAKSQRAEPTPASTWHALAGSPFTEELLEWPADLFALTNVILKRTEAYRFVLSPPCGTEWPPSRFPSRSDAVEDAGRQWSVWLEDRKSPIPELLAEEWSVFRERAGTSLDDLAEGRDWRMCEALLTLHAIADEAWAGLGIPRLREIPLEAGAQGILLTLCGDRATRRSADGRRPVDNVTDYFDEAVHQVRASSAGSRSSNSPSGTLAACVLEADELTILTGWAQALAEALAYAPEWVDVLLANAEAGAPWRDAFQIAEPSPQLGEAFYFMGRAVRAVSFSELERTRKALQISWQEDRPEERGLEMLVRRLLESMLEQLRTRQ